MMSESIQHISIHALREEGDTQAAIIPTAPRYFYPRPPRGGRLRGLHWRGYRRGDFYPRPPRGGRQKAPSCCEPGAYISIHALREEGDSHGLACMDGNADFYPRPPRGGRLVQCLLQFLPPGISIHALREEGDVPISCIFAAPTLFLSTPSARRATKILDAVCRVDGISIHALREEGDIRPASWPCGMRRFLSTPSARRATLMS